MEKIESIANVISPSACEKALLAYLYPLDTSLFIYIQRESYCQISNLLVVKNSVLDGKG